MAVHVALSGRSGSGKTEVASYLEGRHGYVRVSTGPLCRRLCRDLFATESKTLMNAVTDAMRGIQPDVWLAAALRHAPVGQPLVIDSMRFHEDHQLLLDSGYELWRVEAPQQLRWDRLQRRGQEFTPARDDNAVAEVELDNTSHDRLLINAAGLPDLWEQVEAALQSGRTAAEARAGAAL